MYSTDQSRILEWINNHIRRQSTSINLVGSYLHEGGVQVDPVAADVDDHAQLEEERPRRVERAQRRQQRHGSAPVRQHVQHGAELGPLVERAGGVAVESVELQIEVILRNLSLARNSSHLLGPRGCNTTQRRHGSMA